MTPDVGWPAAHAADLAAWGPLLREAARALGFPDASPERLPGGEDCAAFGVGPDRVLKVLAPETRPDRELALLSAVSLPVETPRPLGVVGVRGWTVLGLTRLAGAPAATAWPRVPERDREAVLEALGETFAAIRGTPPPPEVPVPALRDRVRPRWDGAADLGPGVLLHGDLTAENVFLAEGPQGWRLSGVLDFGGSFVGPALLEAISPALFLVGARPARLRALCRGAGWPVDADALLAAHLHHPYFDGPRDLHLLGGAGPSDAEALRRAWRALAEGG